VTEPPSTPEHKGISREGYRDPLAAFLASHDDLQDKLWGHISRLIPHDHDGAGEVYQETLLAFTMLLNKDPHISAPIIFGIARYKIADYWRKQKRRSREILTEPAAAIMTAIALTGNSADLSEAVTTLVDVERAYVPLSDEQQRVLTLRYIHQLTQEEAAEAMGISRSRLRRLEANATNTLAEGGMLDEYRTPPTPTRRITPAGNPEAQS
jgi:RNA polymerase sigma factor (sigma-70 family)